MFDIYNRSPSFQHRFKLASTDFNKFLSAQEGKDVDMTESNRKLEYLLKQVEWADRVNRRKISKLTDGHMTSVVDSESKILFPKFWSSIVEWSPINDINDFLAVRSANDQREFTIRYDCCVCGRRDEWVVSMNDVVSIFLSGKKPREMSYTVYKALCERKCYVCVEGKV